jgi:hypothetical protein
MSLFPALNFGEPPLLYCFVFLYIAAGGPGPGALSRRNLGGGARFRAARTSIASKLSA